MRERIGKPNIGTFFKYLLIPTMFYLFTVICPILLGCITACLTGTAVSTKKFIGLKTTKPANTEFWGSVLNNLKSCFIAWSGRCCLACLFRSCSPPNTCGSALSIGS